MTAIPRERLQTDLDSASERASRIAKRIACAGILLNVVSIIADLANADIWTTAGDVVFMLGCAVSLFLSRSLPPSKPFVWWPALVAFWLSSIPSILFTGGLKSPILISYLSLFFIGALLVQRRFSARSVGCFVGLNLIGRWVVSLVHRMPTANLSDGYLVVTLGTHLVGIVAATLVFLKTEQSLTSRAERHFEALALARIDVEKGELANAAKSAFLANVSHELRTPLGAILGYSELLQNEADLEGEHAEFLNTVRRNGLQLSELVDDLLDISKVEAGKLEIEYKRLDPRELLRSIEVSLGLTARQKNLHLRLVGGSGVPDAVITDPSRLRQILINLVSNALKYTDFGSVELRMTYDLGTSILRFDVTDTGAGIPSWDREKLFKPFGRIDNSMTRKNGGTGLGLHLSKRLAELMGGKLILSSSQVGRGSTFTLTLPARPDQVEGTLPSRAQPCSPLRRLAPYHILLVDDNPDNLQLISRYLKSEGARLDTAVNGLSALQANLHGSFDLIVMDIQMPVLDGLEAARMLREQGFRNPIVALTAHAMKDDRERCMASGYNGYLTKPVNKEDLITTLLSFLSSHESREIIETTY